MDAETLRSYIRQEVRKEVYGDRIELYLPFFFGSSSHEPLCLTWDRNGTLTDGGRTLSELKKRVGSLEPYRDAIRRILGARGNAVTLTGGQKLTLNTYVTCIQGEEQYLDYRHGLNQMLRVISQISVVDAMKVSEDGEVWV